MKGLEVQYQGQVLFVLSRIAGAWIDVGESPEAERESIIVASDAVFIYFWWATGAYGGLMVSLIKFNEDFDDWFDELTPSFEAQDFSASEFLQFDELRTRHLLAEADLMLEKWLESVFRALQ